MEIGLIASLTYFYNPRSKTLFPVSDEATAKTNDATTYTRSALLPYAVSTSVLVFGGLTLFSENFNTWTQVRGFSHALLLSEVAVSAAKFVVQKKRPNHNEQVQGNQGVDTEDSRASFYSDHANQAFALATYTSLSMFKFSNSVVTSTIYSISVFCAASIISYSRVQYHAHNLSDVIVGAMMGTTISGLTFFRVQEVNEEEHRNTNITHNVTNWDILPSVSHDNSGRTWYTAEMSVNL